jgi:hypothetical protein
LTRGYREKFSTGSQTGKESNKTSVWFQTSATMYMRFLLFWDITQVRLVVTDVSVQPIVSIFKGQAVRGECRGHWKYTMTWKIARQWSIHKTSNQLRTSVTTNLHWVMVRKSKGPNMKIFLSNWLYLAIYIFFVRLLCTKLAG